MYQDRVVLPPLVTGFGLAEIETRGGGHAASGLTDKMTVLAINASTSGLCGDGLYMQSSSGAGAPEGPGSACASPIGMRRAAAIATNPTILRYIVTPWSSGKMTAVPSGDGDILSNGDVARLPSFPKAEL